MDASNVAQWLVMTLFLHLLSIGGALVLILHKDLKEHLGGLKGGVITSMVFSALALLLIWATLMASPRNASGKLSTLVGVQLFGSILGSISAGYGTATSMGGISISRRLLHNSEGTLGISLLGGASVSLLIGVFILIRAKESLQRMGRDAPSAALGTLLCGSVPADVSDDDDDYVEDGHPRKRKPTFNVRRRAADAENSEEEPLRKKVSAR